MVLNNSFNYIFTVKPLLNHTSIEHNDQNGALYPTEMVTFGQYPALWQMLVVLVE